MSGLAVEKFLDPRLDMNTQMSIAVADGATNWVRQRYPKTSCSDSRITFSNQKTTGDNFLISTKWYIEYDVTVEVNTSNNPCDTLLHKGHYGLRAFPLHQCTHTITLRLNNKSIDTYAMDTLNARAQYWSKEDYVSSGSMCPHSKCKTQRFIDSYGTDYNPLGGYGDTYRGDADNQPNGVYRDGQMTIDTNNQNYAKITYHVREPVMAEPLDYFSSSKYGKSMWNLTNFEIIYQLQNLAHMFCFDSEARCYRTDVESPQFTVNSVVVHINPDTCSLLMDVATPPKELAIPGVWATGYRHYSVYKTPIGNVAPNASGIITSQTLTLSEYPRSFFFYIQRTETDNNSSVMAATRTDTWAQINSLSVTIGNNTRLLADCQPHHLYLMALNNGLQDTTWNDWGVIYNGAELVGMTGSVLRITPQIDLVTNGGDPIYSGTVAQSTTFQVQIGYTNINQAETINYDLYVVMEMDGVFELMPNGDATDQTAVLGTGAGIAQAPPTTAVDEDDLVRGGGKFKDFIGKVGRWFRTNRPLTRIGNALGSTTPWGAAIGALGQATGSGVYAGGMPLNVRGGARIGPDDFYETY